MKVGSKFIGKKLYNDIQPEDIAKEWGMPESRQILIIEEESNCVYIYTDEDNVIVDIRLSPC